MSAKLPLLVADLPDEASVERLSAIAREGGAAWVPLLTAPRTSGLHVLELVHPGAAAPVLVGAVPTGTRSARGFPLRLSVLPEEEPELDGGALVLGALVARTATFSLHRGRHRDVRREVLVHVAARGRANDPEVAARFLEEARAVHGLAHPHVVPVVACGHDDGVLWVAWEGPEGHSLRERLGTEGPFTPARVAPIATQIGEALVALHAKGVLHRDLRPENVVLDVALERDASARVVARVHGVVFGHATGAAADDPYASPEARRGEPLDVRSDVYGFGVLLHELVTGERPVRGEIPSVDPRVDRLLARALAEHPDQRFASMRELVLELSELARPAPSSARSLPAPPSVPSLEVPPVRVRAEELAPLPSSAPSRPSAMPDWLEVANAGHSKFLENMRVGAPTAPDVAVALERDPKAWAAKLVATSDVRAFEAEVRAAGRALAKLVDDGDAKALWTISSALDGIATEEKPVPGTRAFIAAHALAWFTDKRLLARVAERRLACADPAAHTLLVRAAARGAQVLYGARVKVAGDPSARAPFVETLRAIGVASYPVIETALQRMPDDVLEGRHGPGVELAEDLLASLPLLPEDADPEVLARYLRARVPSLAEAAARGYARLAPLVAGERLTALLDDPREGIRAAAIAGLRELGAVDAPVVAKLAPVVRREVPATPALRLAAIAALRAVAAEARPVAAPLLVGIVRASGEERTVHAAAEALLSMLGNQARAVVLDRMDRSEEPLRSALAELLKDPTLEL